MSPAIEFPGAPAPGGAGRRSRIGFSNYDALANPYYGGGGARAIHEIARRLTPAYGVTVVTGRYPGSRDETVDGVRYERIGLRPAGPYLGQLLFQFLLPWKVRRGDHDLWVESLTPPFSTACLPWFTRRPVIALTQVLAGAAMSRKYKLPFAAIERFGLRSYRHAIVLSTHLQAVVRRANPRIETIVVPNGVSSELIALAAPREENHLLFLGRIDIEQKGLDLLLDALASIASRITAPVLIAGAGPPGQEDRLRQRVQALGLAERVRLVGRVDDRAKGELLRQSILLLLPSRFEASPLVLMEAFCHQVPALVFDIPELEDIPADCCVKSPAFDPQAYGANLLRLLADRPRRLALGQAAKSFVRRFDWDEMASRYAAFIERVLSQARCRGFPSGHHAHRR